MKKIIFTSFFTIINLSISCSFYAMEEEALKKRVERENSVSQKELSKKSELQEKLEKLMQPQPDQEITIVAQQERKFFSTRRSHWIKVPYFRSVLDDEEKKNDTVALLWQLSEIEQMDSYLQVNKASRANFIKSLSVPGHIQLIKNLGDLNLIKQEGFDDFDNAVQAFVTRPNAQGDQENIERLLKEVESLSKNISPEITDKLLKAPEFYTPFICQQGEVIEEEQVTEMIVMKKYWGGIVQLCIPGKVIYEFRNVSDVLKVDNSIVIGSIISGIRLLDLHNLKVKNLERAYDKVFRADDCKIALVTKATNGNNGELIVCNIKAGKGNRFPGILNAFPVADLIAIQIGCGHPRMDEFCAKEYEKHDLHFLDTKKKEYQNIRFQDLYNSFCVSGHKIAMRGDGNVKIYNTKTGEIKEFEFPNVIELFRVSDALVAGYDIYTISVIDIETGKMKFKFQNIGKTFQASEHIIVTYNDDTIRWHNTESREIKELHLKKSEALWWIKRMHLINELAVINCYEKNGNNLVKIFNWKKGKLLYTIKAQECEVKGDIIWLMNNGILKRLGPDLNLKKLKAEQLLLYLSSLRSGKYSSEIN